jgi:single-stranded-DNA-specific exonuclease
MTRAVNRIVKSIKNGQKIAILGDYDVDGVASVSIFIKFLEHIGADYAYYIPSRMDDGYGLNIPNIEKHRECLIIAVDCGSSSSEELKYAKDNNIEVVVLDHHRMSSIPDDAIIVNPHRPDEKCGYRYLCAAGLVFLCVMGINDQLKKDGFYSEKEEPDIADYLDLVALATVCDVVELIELNRAFVAAGIKIIRQRKNFGIDALLSLAKGNVDVNAEVISFVLGPKLNAAGRMASADLSVQLLTTQNPIKARKAALQLDELNKKRQAMEQEMMTEAISSVLEDQNFICVYNPDWHVGITGIIAGRLREKYNRPSIVISCDSQKKGKASCRSVDGIDISAVIKMCVDQGIITSGGGHSMAGGFSIDVSRINDLLDFLPSAIKYKPGPPELYADCAVPLSLVSADFVKSISVLEPFGMGNRYPKFIISNIKIVSAKVVGENHIAFTISNDEEKFLRGISFRSLNTPLGDILFNETSFINVLGTLAISSWNNQEYVNFQLEDVSPCF